MKQTAAALLSVIAFILMSCHSQRNTESLQDRLAGTWRLLSSESHTKDTVTRENLEGKQMIKIITGSHFAFLYHDLNKGKDSTTATFVAGGGACSFTDSTYTEHLEYCNYRDWEGLTVSFKASISHDTLTLQGIESKSDIGVNQVTIEKYVKL